MTVAELHKLMDARFTSQGTKIDDLQECVHLIQIGIAKRSGTFAVLTRLALVALGVAGTVAGAIIISAI